jgi:hypothetical protein
MTSAAFPREVWDHEAIHDQPAAIGWLWHGFLAPDNITLLTSLWKAGKTTLIAMLLARRKTGGVLAGLAVRPGKTVVISEEPLSLWAERARRYDFGNQVCFFSRPFRSAPSPEDWQALVGRILDLRAERQVDLVVIDPIAPLLRHENHARGILDTLMPLSDLASHGMGVLITHHPGRGYRPAGQAARGSGALLGHVDISMEMRHPGGDPHTRKRRFLGFSRHADTPSQLLLELNPDATDYVAVADSDPDQAADPFTANWNILRMVFEDAPQKLTRGDILAEWPPDFEEPPRITLWRWLDRAVRERLIACEGSGRKTDPFRYWLPEREVVWRQNPFYVLYERNEKDLPFESLQERKRKGNFVPDPTLKIPGLPEFPVSLPPELLALVQPEPPPDPDDPDDADDPVDTPPGE